VKVSLHRRGAHGDGRVYAKGSYVGNRTMTQATVGLQIGGTGYSGIVFFQDKRTFNVFTSDNFEFGAGAEAVAVTAAAQAQTSTGSSSAGASASNKDAATAGNYYKEHGDIYRDQGWANRRIEHRRPEVQL
jgi:hypothetical protein